MSIRLKTILGVAIIEALLLAILVSMTLNHLKSSSYEALDKRADTTVRLFASMTVESLLTYDLASLQSLSHDLLQNPDIKYVKITTSDGKIFAQAGDPKQLRQTIKEDHTFSDIDDGIFDIKKNVSENGHLYGIIYIGIDVSDIEQTIKQAWYWSGSIALGEMLLVALFSFILGTYLTNQLIQLKKAVTRIAEGDMESLIEVKGTDEISAVVHAFNKMSNRLKTASDNNNNYQTKLETLNKSLEEEVFKQTDKLRKNLQELEASNTRLKQAQTQLIQSEKMASLGTLVAGIAHEINNPLGYITSNLDTLRGYIRKYIELTHKITQNSSDSQIISWMEQEDFYFINDDVIGLLSDTQEGTLRVTNIVSSLKEFSHMGLSKNMTFENINDAIENTLRIVNNEINNESQIICDLQPLPLVKCNVGQIQQVLLNLIINAIHATENDGTIRIKTSTHVCFIEIVISDEGCGIEESQLPKIFDPFYTTKKIGRGIGLGLSVAYGIIEEHHGSISVTSKLGKGTSFTLNLPIEDK